jgi:WD40 repeat protein
LNTEQGNVPISFSLQTAVATIYSVAYSPDGRQVLAGDDSGQARTWDTQTGKLLLTLTGHSNAILGVRFSHDGKIISTASTDMTIRLWDAQTGTALRTLSGHTNSVRIATFSPDDQWIYSASEDDTVRAWEVRYQDTIQYVCSRVIRDLTDQERTQYNITDQDRSCAP